MAECWPGYHRYFGSYARICEQHGDIGVLSGDILTCQLDCELDHSPFLTKDTIGLFDLYIMFQPLIVLSWTFLAVMLMPDTSGTTRESYSAARKNSMRNQAETGSWTASSMVAGWVSRWTVLVCQ